MADKPAQQPSGPLAGIRVLDAGVLLAGPTIATLLGDFGADVVKIEHPRGDPLRALGQQRNGVSLWWAHLNRNKRCVSLNLSLPDGQELLKRLVAGADVLIESFRPGTMEGWGLGFDELREVNPALVMVRTSGFGQTGPYSSRPGFGTIAEAMTGFASMHRSTDGTPVLPAFAMAHGVSGLYGAIGVLAALQHRDTDGRRVGQVIDLSLYEPLLSLLGPQPLVYDQLGAVPANMGNATDWTAPRNAYRLVDGSWVALSASSQSIAERVARIVGCERFVHEPWFADNRGRLLHNDEFDEAIAVWMASRTREEALSAFAEHEAVIGPIYSVADAMADEHFVARGTFAELEDDRLGTVRVQAVVPRLLGTPGAIRHLGRELGADNRAVYVDELGYTDEALARLRQTGTI